MVNSRGTGLALVIGLLSALWSASGYVGAFGRAMNRVYEVSEGRPVWKLRPVNLAITVFCVLVAALMLVALVISGPVAEPRILSLWATFISQVHINERFAGKFHRALTLPDDADPEGVDAHLQDGVLHITVRRRAAAQPRRIEIH